MPDSFEIVVGTYEQYLLGYKAESIVNEFKIEKSFATHSHLASVRSVSSNKHYLASAGADDSVYIYDMRYRLESGRLIHHNDTVNCVTFSPDGSHLFTCSNDGSIAAIRCGNWQLEKHWKQAHKGCAVNTLAIHPTGKIGLSIGGDGVLRTWNLVKGRQAYATNLVPKWKSDAKNISVLKWSPNGEKYLLAVNEVVDIYSVDIAGVENEMKFDSKVVCVEFLTDNLIAVGCENGKISLYDLEKSLKTVDVEAHNVRVKCMMCIHNVLVSVSSSGEIKVWRFNNDKMNMVHCVNCGARITCLTIALPCKILKRADDVKVEEEIAVKRRKKFSLKQKVIIEDEGDWEVTNVDSTETEQSKPSKAKKKKTKKRKAKKDEIAEKVPKRKKVVGTDNAESGKSTREAKELPTVESENQNVVPISEGKHTDKESETLDLHLRKIKKSRKEKIKSSKIRAKKKKKKDKVTEDTENLPKKKRKKLLVGEGERPLKKKEKHTIN